MEIFIVKGKVKGIAKLDKKLRISLDSMVEISKAILCEKYQKIKIVEKKNFDEYITDIKPDSIVFLNEKDNVLCAGASGGKVDLNRILKLYFKEKPCENRVQIKNCEKIEDKIMLQKELQNNEKLKEIQKVKMKADLTELDAKNDIYIKMNEGVEKGVDFIVEVVKEQKAEQELNALQYQTPKLNGVNEDFEAINYEQNINEPSSKNEKIQANHQMQTSNFFEQIKKDIEGFFSGYPKNTELENAIFSSRWISVDEEFPYSVGVIYDDDTPNIIAYAMPYNSRNDIEDKFLDDGEWLAINKDTPDGRGYLLFYQEAASGKMIVRN